MENHTTYSHNSHNMAQFCNRRSKLKSGFDQFCTQNNIDQSNSANINYYVMKDRDKYDIIHMM